MSTIIDSIEKEQLRSVPRFQAGDRVRVHFQVIEGSRTRTQVFEGVVIKRQGSGARETFTVRKQSFGVGVERTFPVHSPKIEELEVAGHGEVRRAKLYYLRDRVGKAARVAERRWGITEDVLATEVEEGAVDSEGTSQAEAEVEVVEPEQPEATEGEGEGPAEEVDPEPQAEGDARGEAAEPEAVSEPDASAEGEQGAEAAAKGEPEVEDADADEQGEGSTAGADEAEASEQDR